MAVDYTNLFENVGVVVRSIDDFRNMARGTPDFAVGVITAITQADPAVVTIAAHPFVTGERLIIVGVVGMTQVNDIEYTIKKLSANTFSLHSAVTRANIDSSAFTAYASVGRAIRVPYRPDLPNLLADLETVFGSNSRQDVMSGASASFDGYKNSAIGWADTVAGKVDELLTHRTTILEQLPGLGNSVILQDILSEIHRDMVDNAITINRSTVSLSAISADAGNTGDGTIFLDKVLDGASAPHSSFQPNPEYLGVNSELAVSSELMTVTCIQDEDTDGTPSGEERFLVEGRTSLTSPFDWNTEGSGTSIEVTTLNSHQIIANKDFESWDNDSPESWDVDAGVGGTHIIEESDSAEVFRGDKALSIKGDGVLATIQISQLLVARAVIPGKRYFLSCKVKGDATVAAGTLTIQFESASGEYVAGGTEQVVLNAAALAAQVAYDEEHFWITMPKTLPDDLELVIKVTGTLTADAIVRVDSLAFGPVEWVNGISMVIVAGEDQFVRNDRLSFTVSNDDVGKFQTFFRKRYKVQLPSSATPSISDILAG